MLSGVPNFAFLIGYTNASWTLKVGPRLRALHAGCSSYMDAAGYDQVTPTPDARALSRDRAAARLLGRLVMRAVDDFPRQGAGAPWQLAMNPNVDHAVLRDGAIEDPALRFSRHSAQHRRRNPSGGD